MKFLHQSSVVLFCVTHDMVLLLIYLFYLHIYLITIISSPQFTGSIPESYPRIGNLKLKVIHLNNNQLSGELPSDWFNGFDYQKRLLSIRVENNNLSGEFDKSVCMLDVRNGRAEMVELGADCDNCSCKLCERSCIK